MFWLYKPRNFPFIQVWWLGVPHQTYVASMVHFKVSSRTTNRLNFTVCFYNFATVHHHSLFQVWWFWWWNDRQIVADFYGMPIFNFIIITLVIFNNFATFDIFHFFSSGLVVLVVEWSTNCSGSLWRANVQIHHPRHRLRHKPTNYNNIVNNGTPAESRRLRPRRHPPKRRILRFWRQNSTRRWVV